VPFDDAFRGGDPSFREVPGDADVRLFQENHRSESFDHAGIQADPNLGFPLDSLRALQGEGLIGEVAPRHLSFMGSITAPGRLTKETAPAAVKVWVEDQVDLALFVPV